MQYSEVNQGESRSSAGVARGNPGPSDREK